MIKNKVRTGTALKLYLFFSLVLLTGVFIGSLVAGLLPAEKCAQIALPIEIAGSAGHGTVFVSALIKSIKPVVFMWVSGFFAFSVYCNMIAVMYKGVVLGISAGALLKIYGAGRGMVLSFAGIFPQYFVFIPVLIYTCISTFEFSKSRQKPKRKIANYVLYLGIAFVGCLLAALSDTYVTSLLLRLCMIGE